MVRHSILVLTIAQFGISVFCPCVRSFVHLSARLFTVTHLMNHSTAYAHQMPNTFHCCQFGFPLFAWFFSLFQMRCSMPFLLYQNTNGIGNEHPNEQQQQYNESEVQTKGMVLISDWSNWYFVLFSKAKIGRHARITKLWTAKWSVRIWNSYYWAKSLCLLVLCNKNETFLTKQRIQSKRELTLNVTQDGKQWK